MGLMAVVDTEVSETLRDMTFQQIGEGLIICKFHGCEGLRQAPHQLTKARAWRVIVTKHVIVDVTIPLSAIDSIVCLVPAFTHSGIGPTMTTSLNEKLSNEERKAIWVDLQLFRQDTLALRTEAYRLRTAGCLDAAANERLRTQQTELERRGEAIIKRCVHLSG